MKVTFDDQQWQRLEDDLSVARLCGDNAGKVYVYAKSALQQAVAGLLGEKDVPPEEAEHVLALLRTLRNGTQDAARGFASAVAIIDQMIRRLEPPGASRRRRVSV